MEERESIEAAKQNVIVVRARLVGLATALYLLRDGHSVRVIDREPPLDVTSSLVSVSRRA